MGRTGLVIGLVLGIVSLIIGAMIALSVITNMVDVEETIASYYNATTYNEVAWVNSTSYTVADADLKGFRNAVMLVVTNSSDEIPIAAANYTFTTAGVLSNNTDSSTPEFWDDVLINYTYEYQSTAISSSDLRENVSAGINEISEKIPTVLKIAAIVLIMGILVFLWVQYKRMNIGDSGRL